MKVIFRRNWFAPDGSRFRKSVPMNAWGARDVPEHFRAKLPSDAKVIDDAPAPAPVETPEETLRDFDELRAANAAEDAARAKAEEFQRKLAAEAEASRDTKAGKRGK